MSPPPPAPSHSFSNIFYVYGRSKWMLELSWPTMSTLLWKYSWVLSLFLFFWLSFGLWWEALWRYWDVSSCPLMTKGLKKDVWVVEFFQGKLNDKDVLRAEGPKLIGIASPRILRCWKRLFSVWDSKQNHYQSTDSTELNRLGMCAWKLKHPPNLVLFGFPKEHKYCYSMVFGSPPLQYLDGCGFSGISELFGFIIAWGNAFRGAGWSGCLSSRWHQNSF